MRVVADSHTLIWYLFGDPDQRLSQTAREVLAEAENTDGIAVSVASILDIWYVTQKASQNSGGCLRHGGAVI